MLTTVRTKKLAAAAAALAMILTLTAGTAWAGGDIDDRGSHDEQLEAWLDLIYGDAVPIDGAESAARVLWFIGILQP